MSAAVTVVTQWEIRADVPQLDHVRHVKESGILAGVLVRGQNSILVLNGHVPAGKGNHLAAVLAVEVSQHSLLQHLLPKSSQQSTHNH